MQNSTALSGIGGYYNNPFLWQTGNYYNDPYFLQAFAYQPNFMGAQSAAIQAGSQAGTGSAQASIMQPAAQKEPKKKNGLAALIIGGVLTAGAAALCYKKGAQGMKFFERIADGAKVCKDGIGNWFKKVFKGAEGVTAEGAITPSSATATNSAPLCLPVLSVKTFKECGGIINGEEFVTATGEKYTGKLLSLSGETLNILNGRISPAA